MVNCDSSSMISIDARLIHSSGIGTYLSNLLPLVIDEFKEYRLSLLGNTQKLLKLSWVKDKKINVVDLRSSIYSLSEQIELVRAIPQETILFWSPHYNIPLFYKGKLLVTIHDVCHLAMPEYFGGLHKQLYAKLMFKAIQNKADAILCDSWFTKFELERFKIPVKQPVFPIHLGIDADWASLDKGNSPCLHNNPYLIYVGNIKPHKNLSRLLKAFELIVNRIPHNLICVGKKEGFITGDSQIASQTAQLEGRVFFTGHVSEQVLKAYFVHADALVLPSLYEGFGFPPLEAMACGCPAIVSNVASLPEVCGEAALYFDPLKPQDIADKILKLLTNQSLQEELRRNGHEQAKQFSWEKCARETLEVIQSILA